MIELLSNTAHIHLLLNHVPTVGFGLAAGLFIVGLLSRNQGLEKTGLGLFFFVAVVTIATYVSGNGAESLLRGTSEAPAFPPAVSPSAIRAHEDAALLATMAMEVTGAFAWFGLWQWRRISKLAAWNTGLILVLSLATFGLMARAAQLGGEIRHAEVRSEDSPIAALTLDARGRCTIDLTPGASYRFDRSTPEPAEGSPPKPPYKSFTKTVVQGVAGDIIATGECVYQSDGSGGRQVGRWYQATSDSPYGQATPIGLAQTDIQRSETGSIQVLGRLTSSVPPDIGTNIDEASSLSTAGGGMARDIGLFVTGRTWVWPTLETLHFVGLGLLFSAVLIVDLRMLGMIRVVSLDAMYHLLPLGMLGFGVNLISGMMFFIGVPGQYIHNSTFFWKIVFVLLGGLNVTYFMFADQAWSTGPGDEAPIGSKIAAASAIFIWAAVLFCGHMLPFIGNAF